LNGTHQHLIYSDDVNILGENINTEALFEASREVGLKENTEKTKRIRLTSGNACYHSVQSLLSSYLFSKYLKIKIYKIIILPVAS